MTERERKLICLDKETCPFGEECDGRWNSHDPQTGRLCRDDYSRNFGFEDDEDPGVSSDNGPLEGQGQGGAGWVN
jgi:hypothetical protein